MTAIDSQERQQLLSRYAERYAEIASLAGGLAHEIRNPLSTISMNLDLMVEEGQLTPEGDRYDIRAPFPEQKT